MCDDSLVNGVLESLLVVLSKHSYKPVIIYGVNKLTHFSIRLIFFGPGEHMFISVGHKIYDYSQMCAALETIEIFPLHYKPR